MRMDHIISYYDNNSHKPNHRRDDGTAGTTPTKPKGTIETNILCNMEPIKSPTTNMCFYPWYMYFNLLINRPSNCVCMYNNNWSMHLWYYYNGVILYHVVLCCAVLCCDAMLWLMKDEMLTDDYMLTTMMRLWWDEMTIVVWRTFHNKGGYLGPT